MRARGELTLELKAATDRWPLTAEQRAALLVKAAHLALVNPDPRINVSALRVLVAMDRLNLEFLEREDRRALEARVKALEEQLRGVAGGESGAAGEAGPESPPPPQPPDPLPQ